MKHRISLVRTLATITLAGVAVSFLLLPQNPGRSSPRAPTPAKTTVWSKKTVEATQAAASYGLPVRLKIPKINVDTLIDPVGLTAEGNMQAPSELKRVGWYKFGLYPGNTGSAVIAGHFGRSQNGELAVFEELHMLNVGDIITVEDAKGQVITFVVHELRTFGHNEAAPNVFDSHDGKAHLNLITCQGTWSKTQQTYSDRLVVFSDKRMK